MTKSTKILREEIATLKSVIEGTPVFQALEKAIARTMELESQLREIRAWLMSGDFSADDIINLCDEVLEQSKVLPVGHPGHPQTPLESEVN
jgi:hypothetical protein